MHSQFKFFNVELSEFSKSRGILPTDPRAQYECGIADMLGINRTVTLVPYFSLLPVLDFLGLQYPSDLARIVAGVENQGSTLKNFNAFLERAAQICECTPDVKHQLLEEAVMSLLGGNEPDFTGFRPFAVYSAFLDVFNSPKTLFDLCDEIARRSSRRTLIAAANPNSFKETYSGSVIYLNMYDVQDNGQVVIRKLLFTPTATPFVFVD